MEDQEIRASTSNSNESLLVQELRIELTSLKKVGLVIWLIGSAAVELFRREVDEPMIHNTPSRWDLGCLVLVKCTHLVYQIGLYHLPTGDIDYQSFGPGAGHSASNGECPAGRTGAAGLREGECIWG